MPLGDQITANLPYLRRYARALTGSQSSGDAFVRATLEAALADDELRRSFAGGRVPLYRAFTRLWASAALEVAGATGTPPKGIHEAEPPGASPDHDRRVFSRGSRGNHGRIPG
jgi:DNA-directed RNA polymerase specialized sigma24 family protein